MMEVTSRFIRYYKNYAVVLAAVFYVQPFIFHELQMKIYVPEGWFYYLYLVYWYMTPPLFSSVYGVTSMFCALAVPVTVQFKLLANEFENLKMRRRGSEEVGRLVDYHNFLIEYCEKINAHSSGVFLFEFFITVSVCCILMFIASQDYPLVNKIKYTGFIISQFIDTAIYCYNCELISEASENVGKAIYNSPWYETDRSDIRRTVAFIISRTQKRVVFNGYQLVRVDMQTFTRIFKATLSFVSYLNTVALTEKK
ncbi:unnamed protein product [Tenebrio molitor]|nr:unnamed protein product [Tenebrio molitor]